MSTKRSFGEFQHASRNQSHVQGPLRTILPKKGWEPLSKPFFAQGQRNAQIYNGRKINTCAVPECKLVNCTLRTHRQYVCPPKSRSASISVVAAHDDYPVICNDHCLSSTGSGTAEFVPRNGFHGLEELPDSIAETTVFRSLFHEFFSRSYDRLSLLLSPPPIEDKRRQSCVALAMKSPAYCLNAISSVSIGAILRKKSTFRDPTATVLYGKIMAILRTQVANFQTAEIENLLLIIGTLAVFDIVHGNTSNLEVHRQGMVQLVTRFGGVHNLTYSLTIVLNIDRIFAIFTESLPVYSRLVDRTIQRPTEHPEVYASFFSTGNVSCVDKDVCNFCCDESRIFELFDAAKITFDPRTANTPTASADVLYFYFSRERLAIHFTHLNHKYSHQLGISRCVLLATKILDYTILLDNYLDPIPKFLASKLRETLDKMEVKSPSAWTGHEDILTWILFILVITPDMLRDGKWALSRLGKLLAIKHDGFSLAASEWRGEELQNVKRFVWCSSRLDEAFWEICKTLEHSVQCHA